MKQARIFLLSVMFCFLAAILVNETRAGVGAVVLPISFVADPFSPDVVQCSVWNTNVFGGRPNASDYRTGSYVFTGEELSTQVLVIHKGGLSQLSSVSVLVGGVVETSCSLNKVLASQEVPPTGCGVLPINGSGIRALYDCTYTVENTHGSQQVKVRASDVIGKNGSTVGVSFFFNPQITVRVGGNASFGRVSPGTNSYSQALSVENLAEGGALLDLFVAGTDFYSSNGGICPVSNVLSLSNLKYFARHGAFSSSDDARSVGDSERYTPIGYCASPTCLFSGAFYDSKEVLQAARSGSFWLANLLSPGDVMTLNFRLSIPNPCVGDFGSGQVYLYGEAV